MVQKLTREISVLREHVIEVSKPFFARLPLIPDVLVHVVALLVDLANDSLLVGNTRLLLLDQSVSDTLDLGTHWVQAVLVVLNSVLLLLLDGSFELIHPLMVMSPSLSEDLALGLDLVGYVVA